MSRNLTPLKNTVFSYREETTRGTAPADGDATKIVLLDSQNSFDLRLTREMLENNPIMGTLSRHASSIGMYNDDIGFSVSVFGRGSGTLGTACDYSTLLKHCIGDVDIGTSGTVLASPTPTTTGFTLSGATVSAGHLVRVEVGSAYEVTRILTESSGAVTIWPPVSAAPATSANVRVGEAHLLKSDYADLYTGSGFFYFDGDKKDVLSGCMGGVTFNFEVGQRLGIEFNMSAMSCAESETAIGYTPTSSDWNLTSPPICLGIEIPIFYTCTVVTGSTTTSVILSSTGGLEVAVGDELIVDVGSSVYETKTVTAVSGSGIGNKTVTVSALSGAPAADASAYIKHTECTPSMSITVENTIDKERCMHASSGFSDQVMVDRAISVSMDGKKWKTILEKAKMEAADGIEIWAVLGDTEGNIIAMCMPNFCWTEISRGVDNLLLTQSESGMAAIYGSGDDELFISHL